MPGWLPGVGCRSMKSYVPAAPAVPIGQHHRPVWVLGDRQRTSGVRRFNPAIREREKLRLALDGVAGDGGGRGRPVAWRSDTGPRQKVTPSGPMICPRREQDVSR